jgi:enoyl-CoA hydratase
MSHLEDVVLVEHIGDSGVTVVTLNRPKVRNAVNQALSDRLAFVFRKLEEDHRVRAVVLTGAGSTFCAGIDLGNPVDALAASSDEHSNVAANPVRAMEDFSRPIIGAINGAAVTGGFEIALACDFLVGCHNTSFRDTHCLVGVVPCWGLSQKLSRLIGPGRARMMSFTATRIDAEKAAAWGLLSEIVSNESVLERAIELAKLSAGFANQAVLTEYKSTLNQGFGLPLKDGLLLERRRARMQYGSLGQSKIEEQTKRTLISRL